jgi:hypothetical protein
MDTKNICVQHVRLCVENILTVLGLVCNMI